MKMNKIFYLSASLILTVLKVRAQGTFKNFDFESANVAGYPVGSQIPATNAFPDWTVSAEFIGYDTISLSGGSISLVDTNWAPYQPIQGKYFALFSTPEGEYSVSLGQTGQIPLSAESITFWGAIGDIQVTFDGQPLSFETLSTTANYSIYGSDISEYAGEVGQLLFTQPPFSVPGEIDNIQFSSSPVPEPGEFTLAALGVALFSFRRWRNSSQ